MADESSSSSSSTSSSSLAIVVTDTTTSLCLSFSENMTTMSIITLVSRAGDDVVMEDNLTLNIKIGVYNETPIIDIDDDTPTANGSYITHANPTTFLLHQEDATFPPGTYDLQLSLIDTEGEEAVIEAGIFNLIEEVNN